MRKIYFKAWGTGKFKLPGYARTGAIARRDDWTVARAIAKKSDLTVLDCGPDGYSLGDWRYTARLGTGGGKWRATVHFTIIEEGAP